MIWISFTRDYVTSSGKFFVFKRIYLKRKAGHVWTPFVKVRKRYDTWLGYWGY